MNLPIGGPTAIIGGMKTVGRFRLRCFASLAAAVACSLALRAPSAARTEPWTGAQTVEPAQLADELRLEKDPHVTLIYVGVRTLYNGGHIPGAVFYGPGSSEQGIAELKRYAATLPKNSDVVLYCGCCPLEKCPNLRPAFSALRETGFAQLRVLLLPTSFNVDWVEKGYPVQKSG